MFENHGVDVANRQAGRADGDDQGNGEPENDQTDQEQEPPESTGIRDAQCACSIGQAPVPTAQRGSGLLHTVDGADRRVQISAVDHDVLLVSYRLNRWVTGLDSRNAILLSRASPSTLRRLRSASTRAVGSRSRMVSQLT